MKEELSEGEKMWLACAIDGEGSICLNISTSCSLRMYVCIVNTNLEFVKISQYYLGTNNKINDYDYKEGKTSYLTELTNMNGIKKILVKISPYLIIKREQADILLKYIERRKKNKFLNAEDWADYLRLRLLNDRRQHTLSQLVSELLIRFRKWNPPTIDYEKMIKEAESIIIVEESY